MERTPDMKKKIIAAILCLAFAFFGTLGCEKKSEPEKIGDKIGDAAEEAAKGAEKAADELK